MRVAAYLSSREARRRLRRALAGAYDLTFAADWSELDYLVRRFANEVLIVDPASDEEVEVAAVERLRAYYPSLPVVLYMPFEPDLADALLRLGSVGVHRAVFYDADDTRKELRRAVDEAAAVSVPSQILERVFAGLELEESEEIDLFEVERTLGSALKNIDKIRSVLEWSRHLRLPNRSFYRAYRSYGLPTPKTLLLWLRLMYAARILEDPGYNLSDAVHRMGYSAPSNFWQHVHDTLGLRASELRYVATFDTLLERFLAEQVRMGPVKQASG